MFYAQFVLSKKGPLAKIWLAAHWEKKLSKAQIYETDVDEAVDEIMKPKQKMALRTTGHLLLGIVRIYSRKTKYLLADCNEAFLKIKLAFRPGQLDAPNEPDPLASFKMPELFGDFDATLPEFNEADYLTQPISQSRIDDITLKEDTFNNEINDKYSGNYEVDDFGEHAAGVNFDEDFGEMAGDLGLEFVREMSVDTLFGREREPTPCLENAHAPGAAIFGEDDFCDSEPMDDGDMISDNTSELMPLSDVTGEMDENMSVRSFNTHTTSMERDTFQMEQLDLFHERQEKKKKKRKLLVDEIKNLSGEEMKSNMAEYRDTLNVLDLAPPTRKLMKFKAVGTAEKLFHLPGSYAFRSKPIIRQYQSRLVIVKNEQIQEKNDRIKLELGLGEIMEDEFNYPVPSVQDNAFIDDFEEVAAIDLDNYDANSPVHMELQEDRPPSPLTTMTDVGDDFSPNEKKKRRERAAEEEEPTEGDEDNRWSKRTQAVLNSISNKIGHSEDDEITLTDLLTKGSTRKTAAQKFYTLLVLKKWQAIEVQQSAPYEEIFISAGPNIEQTIGQ